MGKKDLSTVAFAHVCLDITEPRKVDAVEHSCNWANESLEASLIVDKEVNAEGHSDPFKVISSAAQWLEAGQDPEPSQVEPTMSALEWLTLGHFMKKCRRARLDLSANTVHEITPYGEIYGRRPCTFVFDRDFNMIPAAPCGFVSLHARVDEEDRDQEESPYFTRWQ